MSVFSPPDEDHDCGDDGDEEDEGSEGAQRDHGADVEARAHRVAALAVHRLWHIHARCLLHSDVVAAAHNLEIFLF